MPPDSHQPINPLYAAALKPEAMNVLTLDIEAGQLSSELVRRGIAADARVHVQVTMPDNGPLPMAALAQAAGAFNFLEDEPDLYSDADTLEHRC
jgi:hypothetical protein